MHKSTPRIQQIFPLLSNVRKVRTAALWLEFVLINLVNCFVYSFLHFKSFLSIQNFRLAQLKRLFKFLRCPTNKQRFLLTFVICSKFALSTLASNAPRLFSRLVNFFVIGVKLLKHDLNWSNHMRKRFVVPTLRDLFRIKSVEKSRAAGARGKIQSFCYLLSSCDDFRLLFYFGLFKHLALQFYLGAELLYLFS